MNQQERLTYCIDYLLQEMPEYKQAAESLPGGVHNQRRLFRSLMNVRPPLPLDPAFLDVQDAYLRQRLEDSGVTRAEDLTPVAADSRLYLWQGDITRLQVDAIVNAANSALLGCFVPCHGCIDNAIHSAAGLELREACREIMDEKESEEPTGTAEITPGFNLPAKYVLHTVGPIVEGHVTARDRAELASCYKSCLRLAEENGLRSIALCCLSTGVFHFPNQEAAEIAVETVKAYLEKGSSLQRIIFNVYKDRDAEIYRAILGPDAD